MGVLAPIILRDVAHLVRLRRASVAGARLLGRVPAGAGQWGPAQFQAEAAGWISI